MCERERDGRTGETRAEDHRSEPPPKKDVADAEVVPSQPDGLATSWDERIGYSF
ncbi:MAG: hypothetical protein WC348_03920 [Patescibacteria group bacterium]|jgi:hypothetical protein